jgi:hypothetical protein
VWLTRQESNAATAADIEHCAKIGERVSLGEPIFGDPERVTVHLERHDRKLVRYAEIAPKRALPLLSPHVLTSWWCCFGHILLSKIEPITVAQAVAGLNIQIGIADDSQLRAATRQCGINQCPLMTQSGHEPFKIAAMRYHYPWSNWIIQSNSRGTPHLTGKSSIFGSLR